jgi:hypothetical protein
MSNQPSLPTEEGFWLWYILDQSYLKVGAVHVMLDHPKHIAYLRSVVGARAKQFYLYQGGFENSVTYTMYHQAHDHLPPADESNRPLVDGFIPFDTRTLK